MMGTLHEAARRGVPIIVFNRCASARWNASPIRRTSWKWLRSTPIASTYFQVKAGGDAAALKGIMKALLELDEQRGGILDRDFIAMHTEGYEALAADLPRRNGRRSRRRAA